MRLAYYFGFLHIFIIGGTRRCVQKSTNHGGARFIQQ